MRTPLASPLARVARRSRRALCALCALSSAGCLEEPTLTYPAPALDFGAPAAPLTPRLEPDPPTEDTDLAAPDMDPVDQGAPLGPPRLRTLGLSWVGAPRGRVSVSEGGVRLEGSFEWVSGALEATSDK